MEAFKAFLDRHLHHSLNPRLQPQPTHQGTPPTSNSTHPHLFPHLPRLRRPLLPHLNLHIPTSLPLHQALRPEHRILAEAGILLQYPARIFGLEILPVDRTGEGGEEGRARGDQRWEWIELEEFGGEDGGEDEDGDEDDEDNEGDDEDEDDVNDEGDEYYEDEDEDSSAFSELTDFSSTSSLQSLSFTSSSFDPSYFADAESEYHSQTAGFVAQDREEEGVGGVGGVDGEAVEDVEDLEDGGVGKGHWLFGKE
ncbi:hypothetical protein E8E13_001949 [Curvularia kusanoi]|uniref:Uncharacterized protein n=1 Tax=Curvularia kusanoi TaxID=90978 RepID=A0A9P4W690_CURKU|nr:hypothetical protein E8E13_001949 [Curvularia kusanoi]